MTPRFTLEHDWFPQSLPANVEFGDRSWLYSSFAFLHYRSTRPCGVRAGQDTGIYHGTYFDLGPEGEVSIGNFATLVGATICTNRSIRIGNYVFIAHEVVLADSFAAIPTPSSDGGPARSTAAAATSGSPEHWAPATASIVIGDNVWIGARAILLGGARVGEGAIVGAAAVVDFEVPPYSIVAGNPARVVAPVER